MAEHQYSSGEAPEVGDIVERILDWFDIKQGTQMTVGRVSQFGYVYEGPDSNGWHVRNCKLIRRAPPFITTLDTAGVFHAVEPVTPKPEHFSPAGPSPWNASDIADKPFDAFGYYTVASGYHKPEATLSEPAKKSEPANEAWLESRGYRRSVGGPKRYGYRHGVVDGVLTRYPEISLQTEIGQCDLVLVTSREQVLQLEAALGVKGK